MSATASFATRTFDPSPWAACLVAGFAAGALGGVCARIAMRIAVLILGGVPAFTLEGTLGIVVVSAIASALIAIPYTILHIHRRWSTRALALGLAGVLLALALVPLYGIATGDLPGASPAEIARLLLLFVWIPPAVGVALAYGARWLEPRMASHSQRLPVVPSIVLAAAYLFTFISLTGQAMSNTRHPVLVWTIMSASRVDFTGVRDDARLYGLLVALAWSVLAALALWRNAGTRQGQRDCLLLMGVGGLLMAAGASLPPPLRWLPETPWMLGIVQSLGLAALLALALTAGGSATSRVAAIAACVAGAGAALWLLLGQPGAGGPVEWFVWGMVALAFALATISRLRAAAGNRHTDTTLLALFAVLWLLLWAAVLVTPGLRLAALSAFAVTLTVQLFWLPWLLLPVALITGSRSPSGPRVVASGAPPP